jgi:ketosteroid isomerase-like protein
MTISLPSVVSRYFTAADNGDVDTLVDCFTDDAVVADEDGTWHGHAEIREWRENVATAYQYTLEVRGAEPAGRADGLELHDVQTHLEGNFPGGTVDLTYRFGLRDARLAGERIASLEIVPAEAAGA